MKVLVTGGCGFVGSHVCEYYKNKGDTVVAYDNLTKFELSRTEYNTKLARNYNKNLLLNMGVNICQRDIRDYKSLVKQCEDVDFIVHTAAQPAVTISINEPKLDFTTNMIGTFNVMEVASKFQIPMVSCATIHVYGNKINSSLTEEERRYSRNPPLINENHPTVEGKLTPLHASKRSADLYIQTYIDTYKLNFASFRLTGLYGERQLGGEDHGWVANFAIRTLLGETINIYGKGKQVRDILYVKDLCQAFDAFYEQYKPGIYNIGGGIKTSISLLECLDMIRDITGMKPKIKFNPERMGDLRYFVCDTAKAKRNLKWGAKTLPYEGITNLVDWVKNNMELFR